MLRRRMNSLCLVEANSIPRQTVEVSRDDPVGLLKRFSAMVALCEASNGIGLAAVQVGWTDRMFIVKTKSGFRYFVNTSYAPLGEEKFTSCEGCLSLPGKAYLVPRYKSVRVTGSELLVQGAVTIEDVAFDVDDPLYTAVYQHEIDHCFGVMINEIGREVVIRPVAGS